MTLPIKEGVRSAVEPVQKGPAYHQLRVSQAASLADLSKEYALFTHAPLFVFTPLSRDPVWDYTSTVSEEVVAFHMDFPSPIFHGLTRNGDHAWNHRLLLCPKHLWKPLEMCLSKVSVADPHAKKYYRVLVQDLPVPDGLALSKASMLPIPCPMVTVTVFGVDGSDRMVSLAPAFNPPMDLPHVVFNDPEPYAVTMALQMFGSTEFVRHNQQGS